LTEYFDDAFVLLSKIPFSLHVEVIVHPKIDLLIKANTFNKEKAFLIYNICIAENKYPNKKQEISF
jgi:hypothetical protein